MDRGEIHDYAKYKEFSKMMEELQLSFKYSTTLKENGFDEWASVSELDYEILTDLGVDSDLDRKQILACIRAAEDVKSTGEQEELIKVENMVEYEDFENENTEERYDKEADFGAYITKGPITDDKPAEFEDFEQTLGIAMKVRFGHIKSTDLNKRQIEKASYQKCGKYQDFDKFCLGANMARFRELTNLDLQSNNISRIEGLESLINLVDLNLMRNEITKLEGLQGLQNLKILNISKNKISKIEGLQYCHRLQTLKANSQRTKNILAIDPDSIIGVSQSLRNLELEENSISNLDSFQFLAYLDNLKLKGNNIQGIFDLEKGLVCMKYLRNLDMRDNPICKVEKFRDFIVMMGLNLVQLNDKKILKHEREFLFRLHKRKQ